MCLKYNVFMSPFPQLKATTIMNEEAKQTEMKTHQKLRANTYDVGGGGSSSSVGSFSSGGNEDEGKKLFIVENSIKSEFIS